MFPNRVRALIIDGVLNPVAWATGTGNGSPCRSRSGSAANADAVTARVNDPSKSSVEFKSLVDKVLADPQAASAPYDGCRGCGTTFKP